jgi:hypothetical protein
MLQGLLHIYRNYTSFFEEAGMDAIEEFHKLLDEVDKVVDEENFIGRVVSVINLYERLETVCRKYRKRLPQTILNSFKADVTDVIEAIQLLTP